MNEIKFICKVITPMFMAGADSRTPELRPSEFKGMMRFWWRAVKAENNAENKIEELRKEEAKLFGGAGEGEGKSRVRIRIKCDKEIFKKHLGKHLKNDYRLDWHYERRSNSLTGKDAGIGYILYSTVLLNRKREFMKDGFPFEIIFPSFDQKALKQALASFWLSVYLGGFGTRARRGGGNISIEKVEGNAFTIDFIPKGLETKEELKEWLRENINKIKEINPMGTRCKKYSNLKGASILIFDQKKNWIEALNFIGNEFKNFRENNKSDVWRTPAFGMPVMHKKFRERFVPYRDGKRLSERRSSPLIFKVIKSEELYFPVIVRLSGEIVYGGKVAKEQKQDNKWKFAFQKDIKNINDSILNEFLGSLKGKEEVKIE